MIRALLLFFVLTLTSTLGYTSENPIPKGVQKNYAHFSDNSFLTKKMKKRMSPYLLPLNHPLKAKLDDIFSSGRVTKNPNTLAEAGFVILFSQPSSYITVVKHPELPGVLLKLYLDTETRIKKGVEGWEWLCKRCEGAKNVRNIIKKKRIQHFSVPDKWIYPLPPHKNSRVYPVVLVVTDMKLTSEAESARAWKNLNNKKVLKELAIILGSGYSSTYLPWNIPYTKEGKFSCIDTEHPKRKLDLKHCLRYLSPPMKQYWKTLY